MQFETLFSPRVCLCPCLSLRPVCLRVGGCVFTCPPGGEVSVKWVLFSPVGWVRSLQIRTARHCNRSHRRCRRCSRLQRRVGAEGGRAPLPCATPFPARTLSRRALGPRGCCWAEFSAGLLPRPCPTRNPPAQTLPSLLFFLALLALTPVSRFLITNAFLFRFIDLLQRFSVTAFRSRQRFFFPFC